MELSISCVSNTFVNDSSGIRCINLDSSPYGLAQNVNASYCGIIAGYNGAEPSCIRVEYATLDGFYVNYCGYQGIDAVGGSSYPPLYYTTVRNGVVNNTMIALNDGGAFYIQAQANGVSYINNTIMNVFGNTYSYGNTNINVACMYADNGASYVIYDGNTC